MTAHRGVHAGQIAECMGYNLGTAFVALWEGDLDKALLHLQRFDMQTQPAPRAPFARFREFTEAHKHVFNRPSPWCEPVRYAMAAICDLSANNYTVQEGCRLTARAISCVQTAIADERCLGQGQEP